MQTFNVLAALLALVMLARHGRAALSLARPRAEGRPGRGPSLLALINCLVAGAVLWVALKGLLRGLMTAPGGIP